MDARVRRPKAATFRSIITARNARAENWDALRRSRQDRRWRSVRANACGAAVRASYFPSGSLAFASSFPRGRSIHAARKSRSFARVTEKTPESRARRRCAFRPAFRRRAQFPIALRKESVSKFARSTASLRRLAIRELSQTRDYGFSSDLAGARILEYIPDVYKDDVPRI